MVAREMRGGEKVDDLYAATPPLEALRWLFSLAATGRRSRGQRGHSQKLSFVDVGRAYLNADIGQPTYIELPDEGSEPGMVGSLAKCLYGTRAAASRWEEKYTSVLESHGFVRGVGSPCTFVHESRCIKVAVHGDDFTALAEEPDLTWFRARHEQQLGGQAPGTPWRWTAICGK